jgi:hypothetical protein
LAYKSFTTGVSLFLILLAQMGWIIFFKFSATSWTVASTVVTIVAVGTASWWFLHINPKWLHWNGLGNDTLRQTHSSAFSSPSSPIHINNKM